MEIKVIDTGKGIELRTGCVVLEFTYEVFLKFAGDIETVARMVMIESDLKKEVVAQ